jgi:Cu+-exporting ATPase
LVSVSFSELTPENGAVDMNEKEIVIQIAGMACANCEKTVEQALLRVKGVASAEVNLATQNAIVKFEDGDVGIQDLLKAVKATGYQLPVEEAILTISDMTCFNCVASVDYALSNVPGVTNTNISLADEKAFVSYVPGVASVEDFKRAVASTGKRVIDG